MNETAVKLPVAALASGRGSNFLALVDAAQRGDVDAEIRLLISDKPGAPALARAREKGIATAVVERKDYPSRDAFDAALAAIVAEAGVGLVCLTGFMRILSPTFLRGIGCPAVNIHPSLLPAFPGLDAQKQALDYGVTITGCTVHFVDEGVDTGPIILQAAAPVLPGDTVESLAARILEQEHRIYPEAVQLIATGKVVSR
jgi:phosphoribosylglycinamide formyltransferase-1